MELQLGFPGPTQPNVEQSIALVPPDNVEVTRISAAIKGLCKHQNQLHIRLHLPGLRKPVNECKPNKSSSGSKWTSKFMSCVRAKEDHSPTREARSKKSSSLQQKRPDSISLWQATDPHGEFLQESKNGEWIRAPDIQQPSNGQIWLRATGLRIYLLVLVCTTDSYSQSDEGEADRSSRASLSSVLHSSEGSVSSDSFGAMFPYTYFYWESRKLVRKFDIQRSKMTVVDDYIHLLLVPFGNAMWTDEDLQSIQQSAEITRVAETGETEDTSPGQKRSPELKDPKEIEGGTELAGGSQQQSIEQKDTNACTNGINLEAKPDTTAPEPLAVDQSSAKEEVGPNDQQEPSAKASSANVNTSKPLDLQTANPEQPVLTTLSSPFVALQSGVCGDQAGSQDPTATSDAHLTSGEKLSPPAIRYVSRQTSPVFCGGDRSASASFSQLFHPTDRGLDEKDNRQNRQCRRSTRQLLKSRIPVITWAKPKIVDKAVEKEETEEDTTMKTMTIMTSESKAASEWTRRHASSRIPLLKHSTRRHLDGDTGKSESSCQVPPIPSEACSRLPRHSKAINCEAADNEVCSITGRSRPLRKPRKKMEQRDDESRDPEVSRDATVTVRRRRTKYRTRTLETADFSRELRGLDVIRSKLENMTDDQWNRVLAILSGNACDGRPPSSPHLPSPTLPYKHAEDSSPWPRVPRGFSPAGVKRTVEPRETEPSPRSLVRKRERRKKCVGEGTHRHRHAAEEEKAEVREEQAEGLGADYEPTMPLIDPVLTEKPPHSQTHHPGRRTREVHRKRERVEGDLPNYFYRAKTEMQAEKIFGKH